jgi:hypothetical protein
MRYAAADVRKQFFIDMFTRDISLEDCVLDLIDNSLDSYLLKHKVPISSLIFGPDPPHVNKGKISVMCTDRHVKVTDTCGGISRTEAVNGAFCFGHEPDDNLGKLGAYGVGMKRALFKIGNKFHIVSKTTTEGFEVSLALDKWAEDPDWRIPISFIEGSKSEDSAGTAITVTDLREEVVLRIKQGDVVSNIIEDAASTYPYFLEQCVTLEVGNNHVKPTPLRLGGSDGIKAASESFEQNGVRVKMAATIAPDVPGQRTTEQAGWNIFCNGRAVVSADKTKLTGWGSDLPAFHNKYTSFVGLASFESDNPLDLPWTTTKRQIDRESGVFIRARNVMVAMSKPIISMLNKRYPSEPTEASDIRTVVQQVREVSFRDIASKGTSGFSYTVPKKKARTTERVAFDASIASLEKVRRHLRRANLSASEIGKLTFGHYVKTECGD